MLEKELEIGKKAVIKAMRITAAVQRSLSKKDAITKADRSPVTIADFASQAVICRILKNAFPGLPIVAEENSDVLKKPENEAILRRILQYLERDDDINKIVKEDNLFESIDLGCGVPDDKIFWTLDPIDGTKGFLRGEQYAIALALIVKGTVQLGILGCPNLRIEGSSPDLGCLIFAVRGEGARILNLDKNEAEKIRVSSISQPEKMRFVQSYESAHGNLDLQLEIVRILEMDRDPVQVDSQVKYGFVSAGNAEIYLRIPNPKTPDYKEKIWDHAAGSIIVEEAGGRVSDIFGKKLDFSVGKTLRNNTGIFVSIPSVHKRILEIIENLGLKSR
ncbi:MAG: 3'(2'),5'-bisphosphate nucleotidase [Candidatus Aminicenantes bacterium]|nr:3'(2'),5'-bisphosphate nucleotidase [Candidatus Aminicenantes bacterium]